MLLIDIIFCAEALDGISIVYNSVRMFIIQVFKTFSREIVIWCPARQFHLIDIHEMSRIVWVWHKLRNSIRFWADLSIVRTPRKETGTSFS